MWRIMKENKLIEMKNQIETLGSVLNRMVGELNNLQTLTVGLHKTVKNMPGYQEAIEKLKEELEKDQDNGRLELTD